MIKVWLLSGNVLKNKLWNSNKSEANRKTPMAVATTAVVLVQMWKNANAAQGNWQFCHECGANIRCTECVRIICITMDSYSKVSHKFYVAQLFQKTPKKNEKRLEKAENKWYRTGTGIRVPAKVSLEFWGAGMTCASKHTMAIMTRIKRSNKTERNRKTNRRMPPFDKIKRIGND